MISFTFLKTSDLELFLLQVLCLYEVDFLIKVTSGFLSSLVVKTTLLNISLSSLNKVILFTKLFNLSPQKTLLFSFIDLSKYLLNN